MRDSTPGSEIAVRAEISGRTLRLTNLDKVLWPEAGFTKRQMLGYYRSVAPLLLPHVADRPMVLARFPDGVEGEFWFQTQCPSPPIWVRTCSIAKARDRGSSFDYCVIDDEPSLLWAANLGGVELHPLLSMVQSLDRPTSVVFDLDPGPRLGILECCKVALRLRDRLEDLGLASYPKSTGSTGLHVYVPLNSSLSFDDTKSFARAVSGQLSEENPDLMTDKSSRKDRLDKVLVDWAQNNRLRSVVAPYSLRGMPFPTVAAPLFWDEIHFAVRRDSGERLIFLASEVVGRIGRMGDPLEPVLSETQSLPTI